LGLDEWGGPARVKPVVVSPPRVGALTCCLPPPTHQYTHTLPPRPPPPKPNRYTKFRKLGQFEEWAVKGSQWKETREARAAADGVKTAAGTWAFNEAEARQIEAAVDGDEAWDRLLASKSDWTNKPVQPPGLGRCGGGWFFVGGVAARG